MARTLTSLRARGPRCNNLWGSGALTPATDPAKAGYVAGAVRTFTDTHTIVLGSPVESTTAVPFIAGGENLIRRTPAALISRPNSRSPMVVLAVPHPDSRFLWAFGGSNDVPEVTNREGRARVVGVMVDCSRASTRTVWQVQSREHAS